MGHGGEEAEAARRSHGSQAPMEEAAKLMEQLTKRTSSLTSHLGVSHPQFTRFLGHFLFLFFLHHPSLALFQKAQSAGFGVIGSLLLYIHKMLYQCMNSMGVLGAR